MIEVIPAVLAKNYEEMKDSIALVRGICPIVQIDLCDGSFVPSKTWPFSTGGANDIYFQRIINEQEGMPFWEDIDFELDLMVADAVENFDVYTKLGPKRIVFHIEAVGDLNEFKNFVEGMDVYIRDSIQIGIAINNTTPVEQVFSLVNNLDFVQVMGIEKIGFQGQPFDERALGHIKILKEKYPDLIISVDGGVNFESAPQIIEAGASRLVAGSLILKSNDIRETISELESM
ncbi:hypothetical protein KKA39_02660 [Patescibacteria group bacterium]|nr:hypothetical protein [Patescibacteria group bacterium]MBU1728178.1 hypothetical protein [Patescibacteria group bacterium]